MAKTELDAKQFIEYLQAKWGGKSCPMCGKTDWSIMGRVYELREYGETGLVLGGNTIVPIVPVLCKNCGNTVLVNAIIAGLVDRDKEKTND